MSRFLSADTLLNPLKPPAEGALACSAGEDNRAMIKTAVVTGASSGIGAATARALADDGWHVICAARRVERIEPLSAEIGGLAVVFDLTSDESVSIRVLRVGG